MHATTERAILISLTAAIAGGLLLIILARRAKLPAIVLLLFGGMACGPEGLGLVQPASLEGFLPVIVSLAIGLILFEGGLTLDLRGFSHGSKPSPASSPSASSSRGWARPWPRACVLAWLGRWPCLRAAW